MAPGFMLDNRGAYSSECRLFPSSFYSCSYSLQVRQKLTDSLVQRTAITNTGRHAVKTIPRSLKERNDFNLAIALSRRKLSLKDDLQEKSDGVTRIK